MSARLVCLLCCLVVLSTAGAAWGDIVGQWRFDEGSGSVANDSSGNGHHGKILGTAVWVPGPGGVGTALKFDPVTCTGVDCGVFDPTNGTGKFTLALWAFWDGTGTYQHFLTKSNGWGTTTMMFQVELWGAHPEATYTDRVGISYDPASVPFSKMPKNEWAHLGFVYDGANLRLYLNGVDEEGPKPLTIGANMGATVLIGRDFDGGRVFHGMMDDVQIHSQPLTAGEIKVVMAGAVKLAAGPNPADGAVDVPRDAALSWKAGRYAAAHDVYLGKTLADVNNASRTKPAGFLASQDQAATTYTPAAPLAYGQTYYWRVDEVNKAPDNTIFKGNVWSFTVEPYGYPITKVTATASTFQNGMGPEKTIDGSGMTGDLHGNDPMTMWMSKGTLPNWIQYEFDKGYKLWDLKVWNSNQSVEGFVGFGARKVTVEYSADGTTWKALDNVPEFGRGTGLPGYAANTTVNFGGVTAKFVKLTINQTWGGMSAVTGLSEVRFSYVPLQAQALQPANGAAGLGVNTTLSWRPGREASSHKVFFGTDQVAVTNGTAAAKSVTDHAFDPGTLTYGTKYYWKVDEVNTVTYPGEVWNFTTQEFAVVDDFESYNDSDNCIFDTWIDGMADGKSGSQVGYLNAPFAETTIIHGGKQSMPMAYDNTKTPFYSETTREFDTLQDWTANGATHLGVWFRGYPAVASVAVTETAGKMTLTGDGTDIWNASDDFVFAYKTLTGDGSLVARVVSIGAGTNTWAKGGVMIRDSLDSGSLHANTVLTANSDGTAGNGACFQWRPTANSATGLGNGTAAAVIKPPYWVKIERKGDSITGYISANGTTWSMLGTSQTLKMTAPVYIGLCVTSHQAGEQRTFTFDSISSSGGVTGSWQGAQINSPRYNDAAGLYAIVEDSSGVKKTVVHPNPAAAATGTWTLWPIPLSDLTSGGVKMTKIKKLTLGAGDRNSPKAGGTGMLYLDDIGYGHPLP